MKGKKIKRILLIAGGLIFFVISTPFQASSEIFPEDGRIIRFIVPIAPGGGFDLYSRSLQPFLKKYLPWKKGDVVVENVVGAGQYTGSRELFFSKPDGYTIGVVGLKAILFQQLLEDVVKFDLTKYTFLGQFNNYPTFLSTNAKHPFLKSFSDLKKAPRAIIMAASSIMAVGSYWVLKEKVGIKNVRFLVAYKNQNEVQLAMLQGEVDLTGSDFSSLVGKTKSGELRALFHYGDHRLKEAPEVPSIKDLGYEEFAGHVTMDRTIVGPPNIPKDRVKILEEAISKALNDPELIAMSEKVGRSLDPLKGEETKEGCLRTINFWSKYQDQIKDTLKKDGYF